LGLFALLIIAVFALDYHNGETGGPPKDLAARYPSLTSAFSRPAPDAEISCTCLSGKTLTVSNKCQMKVLPAASGYLSGVPRTVQLVYGTGKPRITYTPDPLDKDLSPKPFDNFSPLPSDAPTPDPTRFKVPVMEHGGTFEIEAPSGKCVLRLE
jgi:hypothetical protein